MTQPAQGLAYIAQEAERRLRGYCDHNDCCRWTTGEVREFIRDLIADTEGEMMTRLGLGVRCAPPLRDATEEEAQVEQALYGDGAFYRVEQDAYGTVISGTPQVPLRDSSCDG